MKWLVLITSFLNGTWMILDGIHVMIRGKYVGPEKPGPWAWLFEQCGVNVFRMGPVFIVYGILWLLLVYAVVFKTAWAPYFLYTVPLLSLWYLPVGTLISIVVLAVMFFSGGSLLNP